MLVVSHDPTLILMAGKRVVMKNGGMDKVCQTTPEEKIILNGLTKLDKKLIQLKEQLRKGNSVGLEVFKKGELPLWPEF